MRFGRLPLAEAEGAILAHSLRFSGGALKKGVRLTAAHLAALSEAGIDAVVAARLEADDLAEDVAAARLVAALAPNPAALRLSASAPFTGRCNLYAETGGVLRVDAALVAEINAIDEAVTLATLPDYARVAPRQMVATVKIIPYAAPVAAVAAAETRARAAAETGRAALRVSAFRAGRVALVMTRTPGMRDAVIEKGAAVVRARLDALGAELVEERTVAHDADALAMALQAIDADLTLVLAASATSDRRDVAPAAIVAAGGEIERLGMPVDPGNLLILGRIGARPVLGLPGCARSPKLNGADWVLERLVAGVAVTSADIAAMGVGGLLKEIPSRPQPRTGGAQIVEKPFVSAVLLAAGGSRRMRGRHKLLEEIDGAPLVRRCAEQLCASGVDEVVVVVGAEAETVRTALQGLDVRIVDNPEWGEGVAASIRAGVRATAPRADAALLAFADMPDVDAALVNRVIAAFDPEEGRALVRPIAPSGRPGHPVLFGRRFFEALTALTGDLGARDLLRENADYVVDLPVETDAPIIDLDTPEDWAAWRAGRSRA